MDITRQEVLSYFGNPVASSLTEAQPIEGAAMLWLNIREAKQDPVFSEMGGDREKYEQHLLTSCAYSVTTCATPTSITIYADRYGGNGLEGNGGAGRAAFINGYYVKGVGRTSLISSRTHASHATGGAYLEEAVREAIFGELFAAEAPHSALATLAIIDTGRKVYWKEVDKTETVVLIVRRPFLRPAHFDRALEYSAGPLEQDGTCDVLRVRSNLRRLADKTDLGSWLSTLVSRLAAQFAFAYANRLSYGGISTSNMTADGRLADFGGSSALPSFSTTTLNPGGRPISFNSAMQVLNPLAQDLAYYTFAYGGFNFEDGEFDLMMRSAWSIYRETVHSEILLQCGLPPDRTRGALLLPELAAAIDHFVDHFQRAREIDLVMDDVSAIESVELYGVWSDNVPACLQPLKRAIFSLGFNVGTLRDEAERRSSVVSRLRPSLIRESLKKRLFVAVDSQSSTASKRFAVEAAINKYVAENRRLSRQRTAHPIVGFECDGGLITLVIQDPESGRVERVPEDAVCNVSANDHAAKEKMKGEAVCA